MMVPNLFPDSVFWVGYIFLKPLIKWTFFIIGHFNNIGLGPWTTLWRIPNEFKSWKLVANRSLVSLQRESKQNYGPDALTVQVVVVGTGSHRICASWWNIPHHLVNQFLWRSHGQCCSPKLLGHLAGAWADRNFPWVKCKSQRIAIYCNHPKELKNLTFLPLFFGLLSLGFNWGCCYLYI